MVGVEVGVGVGVVVVVGVGVGVGVVVGVGVGVVVEVGMMAESLARLAMVWAFTLGCVVLWCALMYIPPGAGSIPRRRGLNWCLECEQCGALRDGAEAMLATVSVANYGSAVRHALALPAGSERKFAAMALPALGVFLVAVFAHTISSVLANVH